jgi:hypothetical protein
MTTAASDACPQSQEYAGHIPIKGSLKSKIFEEEMMFATMRLLVVVIVSLLVGSGLVLAQKKYDPGAIDAEIKIGQTMP